MLWVERMLAFEVLPELYREVRMQSLKRGVGEHLEQTKGHVVRVEQAFRSLGLDPSSNLSMAVDGMRRQHSEVTEKLANERLADLFHASAAIRTEHFEIASYTALIELAEAMRADEVADLLEQNKKEEEQTLKELEKLAERLAKEVVT